MAWDDEGLWFSLIVATVGCTAIALLALRLVGYPPSMVFARILRPNHICLDPAKGTMVMARDEATGAPVRSSLFSLPPLRRLLSVGEEGYEGEGSDNGNLVVAPAPNGDHSPLEKELLAAKAAAIPPPEAMLTQDPKVDSLMFMLKLGLVLLLLGVSASSLGIAAVSATDDYLAVLYYKTDAYRCRSIWNETACEANAHCLWTPTGRRPNTTTITSATTTQVVTTTEAPSTSSPFFFAGMGGALDFGNETTDDDATTTTAAPNDGAGYCAPVPTKGLYDLSIQNIAPNRDYSPENPRPHLRSTLAPSPDQRRRMALLFPLSASAPPTAGADVDDAYVGSYEEWRWYVVALLAALFGLVFAAVMTTAVRNSQRYVRRVMRLQSRHALGYRTVLVRNVPAHIAADEGLFRRTFLSVEGLATPKSLLSVAGHVRRNFTNRLVRRIGRVERGSVAGAAGDDPHSLSGFTVTAQRPILRGLLHLAAEVPAASLRLFSRGVTLEDLPIPPIAEGTSEGCVPQNDAEGTPDVKASSVPRHLRQTMPPLTDADGAAAVGVQISNDSSTSMATRKAATEAPAISSQRHAEGDDDEDETETAALLSADASTRTATGDASAGPKLSPASVAAASRLDAQQEESVEACDYTDKEGDAEAEENSSAVLGALSTVRTLRAAVSVVPCRTVTMGAEAAFSKYQSALIALQDAVAKEREHHRTVAADREAKLTKELRAREKKQLRKGGAAAPAPMGKEESTADGGDGDNSPPQALARRPTASYKNFPAPPPPAPSSARHDSALVDPRDLSPDAPTAVPPSAAASPDRLADVASPPEGEGAENTHSPKEGGNGNDSDGERSDFGDGCQQNTSEFFNEQWGPNGDASASAKGTAAHSVSIPQPGRSGRHEEEANDDASDSEPLIGGAAKDDAAKERELFTSEERAERAAIRGAPLPPLLTRPSLFNVFAKKVSLVGLRQEELRTAAKELSSELAELESGGSYNGAVFVVFEDAACAVEFCEVVAHRFSTGVTTVAPPTVDGAKPRKVTSLMPVTAVLAGPPDEVHRSSLNINTIAARTFFLVSMALFVWLVFFYSIPVAALSSLEALTQLPYGIGEWLDEAIISHMSVTVRGTVQAYLPVIVLAVFHAVLPIFVRASVIASGTPNVEETNTWQSLLMFLFAFLTSVVFQAVLQGGFSQLGALIEDPQWETVSAMLVAVVSPAGGYWYALVMGSFIGMWVMALNVGPLLKALVLSRFATSQHSYDALFARAVPKTQALFPSALVMLAIGILFHATVPVLALACGVFFLFAYVAARGVFLDIYKSPLHNTRQRVSSFGMLRYGLRCVSVLYAVATVGLVFAMLVKRVWWPPFIVLAICLPSSAFVIIYVFLKTALWHPSALLLRAWAEEDEAAGFDFSSRIVGASLRRGGLGSARKSALSSLSAQRARDGEGGKVTSGTDDDDSDDEGFIFNMPAVSASFAGVGGGAEGSRVSSPAAPPLALDGSANGDPDGPAPAIVIGGAAAERDDAGRRGGAATEKRMVISKPPAAAAAASSMEATVYVPDQSFFVDASTVFSAYEYDYPTSAAPAPSVRAASANSANDKKEGADSDDDDGPAPILLLEGAVERDDAVIMAFNQSRRMQIDKLDDAASVCLSYSAARNPSVLAPSPSGSPPLAARRVTYLHSPAMSFASHQPSNLAGRGGSESAILGEDNPNYVSYYPTRSSFAAGPFFAGSDAASASASASVASPHGPYAGRQSFGVSIGNFNRSAGAGAGGGLAHSVVVSPFWRIRFAAFADKPWDYHSKIERLVLAYAAASAAAAARERRRARVSQANSPAAQSLFAGAASPQQQPSSQAPPFTAIVPIDNNSNSNSAAEKAQQKRGTADAYALFIDVDGQIEAALAATYTVARYWHGTVTGDGADGAEWLMASSSLQQQQTVIVLDGDAERCDVGRGAGAEAGQPSPASPALHGTTRGLGRSVAFATQFNGDGSLALRPHPTAAAAPSASEGSRSPGAASFAYVYDLSSEANQREENARRRFIYVQEGANTPPLLSASNFGRPNNAASPNSGKRRNESASGYSYAYPMPSHGMHGHAGVGGRAGQNVSANERDKFINTLFEASRRK